MERHATLPEPASSESSLLIFAGQGSGAETGRLDLALLYPDRSERAGFEVRWTAFVASDHRLEEVVWRVGPDELHFRTESLLPLVMDARPPVLFVLGNPAPHSVASGFPFAYEGAYREHRFWSGLRASGFLHFGSGAGDFASWEARNHARRADFERLQYDSPFRLGLVVYFSMPSPAANPPWAGVDGLRKLFGSPGLRRIARAEEARLREVVVGFNQGRGGVVALQRDAYEGLRRPIDPPYARRSALDAGLSARCKLDPAVLLLGGPPTRMLHGSAAQAVLLRLRRSLELAPADVARKAEVNHSEDDDPSQGRSR